MTPKVDTRAVTLDLLVALEEETRARLDWVDRGDDEDGDALWAVVGERQRAREALEETLPAWAPWARLVRDRGLSTLERAIVGYLLCVCESVSLAGTSTRYDDYAQRRIGAVLRAVTKGPREALPARAVFGLDRPLFALGLLESLHVQRNDRMLSEVVGLNADVSCALIGDESMFSHLCPGLEVFRPTETLDDVVLPDDVRRRLEPVLAADRDVASLAPGTPITYGRGTIVLLRGPAGCGKTLTARAIANALGRPLVCVKAASRRSRRHDEEDTLEVALTIAQRDDAVLFLDECDRFFEQQGEVMGAPQLLTAFERVTGLVLLATNRSVRLSEALDRRILLNLDLPLPLGDAATAIWRRHLPEAWRDRGVAETLGRRYVMSGGHIKNAVLQASKILAADGDEPTPDRVEAAILAAAADQAQRSAAQYGSVEPIRSPGCVVPPEVASDLGDAVIALRGVPDARVLVLAADAGAGHRLAHELGRRMGAEGLVFVPEEDLQSRSAVLPNAVRHASARRPLVVTPSADPEKWNPVGAIVAGLRSWDGPAIVLSDHVPTQHVAEAFHVIVRKSGQGERRPSMVTQLALARAAERGEAVAAEDIEWARQRLARNGIRGVVPRVFGAAVADPS